MKDEIEIPFGANDSELIKETIAIPEGCYAKIEDGKVVIRRILSEDERIRLEIISFLEAGLFSPKEIDKARQSKKCGGWVEWLKKSAVWKEEDYNRIDDLIGLLEDAKPYLEKDNKFPDVRLSLVEKWLKSLRPPYYCDDCKLLKSVTGWKPKREQMYILNWVANILLNSNSIADQAASKTLNSLYDELKLLGERNC